MGWRCWGRRLGLWGCVVSGGVACSSSTGAFQCEGDSSCIVNGVGGVCQEVGFCSFPDPTCESEQRYGELAGGGFAGACVPSAEGSTGGPSTASGGPSGSAGTSLPDSTTTGDTFPGTSMGAMTTPGTTADSTTNTSNSTTNTTAGVTTELPTDSITDGTTGENTTVDPTSDDTSTTDDEPIVAPPCADFNFEDAFGAGAMIPNITVFEDNFGTECLPGAAPEVVFYWVAPVAATYEFYADAPMGVDVVGGLWDACDGMEYVCDDDGGEVVDSRIVREVQPGDEFIWVVNVYGELENGISVNISQTND